MSHEDDEESAIEPSDRRYRRPPTSTDLPAAYNPDSVSVVLQQILAAIQNLDDKVEVVNIATARLETRMEDFTRRLTNLESYIESVEVRVSHLESNAEEKTKLRKRTEEWESKARRRDREGPLWTFLNGSIAAIGGGVILFIGGVVFFVLKKYFLETP